MPLKRWLITGVSSGLGKALAERVLAQGDVVIGSVRQSDQAEAFGSERAIPIVFDVADRVTVFAAIGQAIRRVGGLDVLVNNAGYALIGAVEDVSPEAARREFDVNFFGALNVIQAVLPTFRTQRSGRIVNVASLAATIGFPYMGLYCASKFALAGLSAALAKELAPHGIKVLCLEPGGLRTDFGGRSLQHFEPSEPYRDAVSDLLNRIALSPVRAPNDPHACARAIVNLVEMDDPPLHVGLGAEALKTLQTAMRQRLSDYERCESIVQSIAAAN